MALLDAAIEGSVPAAKLMPGTGCCSLTDNVMLTERDLRESEQRFAKAFLSSPITDALCWAHARRKLFELADLAAAARRKAKGKKPAVVSPLALDAVRRIDALFAIERDLNGLGAAARLAARRERSAPLVTELEVWIREACAKLSRHADVAGAMDSVLKRRDALTLFLDDHRICLTNKAAERALRGIALDRISWLFAISDRGGRRAATLYSLTPPPR